MSAPRIYRDRIYRFRERRGISGFQEWNNYDEGIALGRTIKARGLDTLTPPLGPLDALRWRLNDGHLPDYQPRVSFSEACDALKTGKVLTAYADVRPGAQKGSEHE